METSVNNKCKAFTSLEQSEKLAEILPLTSADMHYERAYFEKKQSDWFIALGRPIKSDDILPCWSLAALLGVLPNENIIDKTSYGKYYCLARNIITENYDNPVDACVAMVEKFKELNLL